MINVIRNLGPLLGFMTKFVVGSEMNSLQSLNFLKTMLPIIAKYIKVLEKETLAKENQKFICFDFVHVVEGIVTSYVEILQNMISFYIKTGIKLEEFNSLFDDFLSMLEVMGDLENMYSRKMESVYLEPRLFTVIYSYCLIEASNMRKLAENGKVMKLLVKGSSKIFYNICELYAMQACGVLPILKAKLKALVYLDETGVRIF